jgi:hypothetical protein
MKKLYLEELEELNSSPIDIDDNRWYYSSINQCGTLIEKEALALLQKCYIFLNTISMIDSFITIEDLRKELDSIFYKVSYQIYLRIFYQVKEKYIKQCSGVLEDSFLNYLRTTIPSNIPEAYEAINIKYFIPYVLQDYV